MSKDSVQPSGRRSQLWWFCRPGVVYFFGAADNAIKIGVTTIFGDDLKDADDGDVDGLKVFDRDFLSAKYPEDFIPIKQQIVVIEDVLHLLRFDIGCEQLALFVLPHRAPRKAGIEHFAQRGFAVDRARIDGEAGAFGGKALLGFGKSQLVPDQIHHVGGVFVIVDGEFALRLPRRLRGLRLAFLSIGPP